VRIGADDPGVARSAYQDFDLLWANLLGLGAHQRLLPLARAGRLAPATLDRLGTVLRRHLYEALLALRLGVDDGCPERAWFEAYVFDLLAEDDAEHPLDAATLAATRRALEEVAAGPEVGRLALKGVRDHLALMAAGEGSGLGSVIATIPPDWGPPAVSPVFRTHL